MGIWGQHQQWGAAAPTTTKGHTDGTESAATVGFEQHGRNLEPEAGRLTELEAVESLGTSVLFCNELAVHGVRQEQHPE